MSTVFKTGVSSDLLNNKLSCIVHDDYLMMLMTPHTAIVNMGQTRFQSMYYQSNLSCFIIFRVTVNEEFKLKGGNLTLIYLGYSPEQSGYNFHFKGVQYIFCFYFILCSFFLFCFASAARSLVTTLGWVFKVERWVYYLL